MLPSVRFFLCLARTMSKKSARTVQEIINSANRLHFSVDQGGRARKATGHETLLIPEKEIAEFVSLVEMSVPSEEEMAENGGGNRMEIEEWIGTQASILGYDGDDRFYQLSGRVIVDRVWADAPRTFREAIDIMRNHVNPKTGPAPLIGERLYRLVQDNPDEDFETWFPDPHEYADRMHFLGTCTFLKNYPLRTWDKTLVENFNYLYLRVALAINGLGDDARQHFEMMSSGRVSQASPTMFNAGTPVEQNNSCFLLQIKKDSIEGIYEALKYVAIISRDAGGVGFTVSNIRAAGSPIRGLHPSDGLVPMLRNFNETAHYVDQGKTKRPGAFAVYLDVWHADIQDFCELHHKSGDESRRTHKLHLAIWSNDVFMRRVREKKIWSLMCPHQCPGLTECYGEQFEELYTRYEREGKFVRQVPAEDVKTWICSSMCENGEPYLLQKDHACRGSNQQHLGTLKLSNLCVHGDTFVTTSKGDMRIGSFVPGSKQRHCLLEHRKDVLEQLKTAEHIVMEAGEFATSLEKARLRQIEIQLERMPTEEDLEKHDEIEVWDGKEWVKTTPRLIGEKTPLMTIVTDFGSRLMVSRNHQFLLADGVTRVAAEDLRLGQELAWFPPGVYTGTDVPETARLGTEVAYLSGMLMAYALKTYGKDLANHPEKVYTIKVLRFAKKGIEGTRMEQLLTFLEYDQYKAEEKYPDVDHNELAVIDIPPAMQMVCAPNLAVLEERKSWAIGFLDMLGGNLGFAQGSFDFLQPVVRMFRSVGEEVRLKLDPRDHSWSLCQRKEATFPKVMSMTDSVHQDASYCFDTPSHRAIFEGQVTGQCTEILEFVSPDEIACCTLCSFALPSYWNKETKTFDFDKFEKDVVQQVKHMNNIIDTCYYALEEMRKSNMRHRPLAMGVQGLATLFALADMPWEEQQGERIVPNRRTFEFQSRVFECLYRAALLGSIQVAKQRGKPYDSFSGSPYSKGLLRFDLFPKHPDDAPFFYDDWEQIRQDVQKYGTANSLLIGPMPTATTAKILNNSEGIDPILTNIMVHGGLAGNFLWVNPQLVEDCKARGIWSNRLRDAIEVNQGSVQGIGLPKDLEWKYKTHWELSKKVLIRFQAGRQRLVCQGQSFNTRFFDPDVEMVWRALDYSWKLGNPNGVYYTRSNSAMDAQNMTASLDVLEENAKNRKQQEKKEEGNQSTCSLQGGGCCDA